MYWQDSQTAATMIDSNVTHSFVPRYIFFRFLHIHSFVARTFALCQETGRQMVTEVTVNRMIYVTDVYQSVCCLTLKYFVPKRGFSWHFFEPSMRVARLKRATSSSSPDHLLSDFKGKNPSRHSIIALSRQTAAFILLHLLRFSGGQEESTSVWVLTAEVGENHTSNSFQLSSAPARPPATAAIFEVKLSGMSDCLRQPPLPPATVDLVAAGIGVLIRPLKPCTVTN
ncbi:hypothetical protein LXL04_012485 [Taraxacum kok-saghyz]